MDDEHFINILSALIFIGIITGATTTVTWGAYLAGLRLSMIPFRTVVAASTVVAAASFLTMLLYLSQHLEPIHPPIDWEEDD